VHAHVDDIRTGTVDEALLPYVPPPTNSLRSIHTCVAEPAKRLERDDKLLKRLRSRGHWVKSERQLRKRSQQQFLPILSVSPQPLRSQPGNLLS